MIKRPFVLAFICIGVFLIFQSLIPKAIALRTPTTIDQYMLGGHRTHRMNNNLLQREGEIRSVENGMTYDVEPFEPDRNPGELSAFIVDYANMIRNDNILLDNSVETRTRKRGNSKRDKYNNPVIADMPCSCDYSVEKVDLGEGSFPRNIEIRNCMKGTCKDPYVCKENLYNITILKLRKRGSAFDNNLHDDLKRKWYAVNTSISVGCMCSMEAYTYL